MRNTQRSILLVEDSPEDRTATLRAFERAGFRYPIFNCDDGDEALDYLHRRGAYADPEKSPRPGLILLDLNLPGTDGRQVLVEVKGHEELRHIPVVILTTSADARDIEASYKAGANSYVQKPLDVDGLYRTVEQLKEYWFELVFLPAT